MSIKRELVVLQVLTKKEWECFDVDVDWQEI